MNHSFLLRPGRWIGEGTISLTHLKDPLYFETSWTILQKTKNTIEAAQHVKIKDIDQNLYNLFSIFGWSEKAFIIELRNELVGVAPGKGILTEAAIGWEFHSEKGPLEGFEVYTMEGDGYRFHAEYGAQGGDFRTCIDGELKEEIRGKEALF